MKWYDYVGQAVVTVMTMVFVYMVGEFLGGTPLAQSPAGLQAQINQLQAGMDEVSKYKQEVEEVTRQNRHLMLRTEHLDAEEFRKAIDKDVDWRMAPELRRTVLLNHREFLMQQLKHLRDTLEKNQDNAEWTQREIERHDETVDAEIKAALAPAEETPKPKAKPKKPKTPDVFEYREATNDWWVIEGDVVRSWDTAKDGPTPNPPKIVRNSDGTATITGSTEPAEPKVEVPPPVLPPR